MGENPLVVSGVIGDVLEPFTATDGLFEVSIDGKMFCNGTRFRTSQVAVQPNVKIKGDEFRIFYTLVMVDADAPSPSNPHLREYLHWLVANIPGGTDPSHRTPVMSYESPQPQMGIHRLVLALFRQAGWQTVNAPDKRQNFKTKEFSEHYNLGQPVAAVYYNCNRDNGTGGRRA